MTGGMFAALFGPGGLFSDEPPPRRFEVVSVSDDQPALWLRGDELDDDEQAALDRLMAMEGA